MNIAHQVRDLLNQATFQNYNTTKKQIHEIGSGLNQQLFAYRIEHPEAFETRSNPIVDFQVTDTQKDNVYLAGKNFTIRIERYENEKEYETGYNIYLLPNDQTFKGFFFTYEESPKALNLMIQALVDNNFQL
ncbi:hypothetical protein MK805_15280 [Shimazuella sp. AN120528]|uniref:hypothetical protein n=1 Tax=Shimazuella soli TaxID=1892854 RepID=UPI001F0EE793|nr:hypothetical protein [Shimazuella soli]MCH5586304.1 hypothetical protein [Shimazuella soli]